MMTNHQFVLAINEAAQALSVNRATIYELHKSDPTFPRIFKVAGKKSGILAVELDEWITSRRMFNRIDGKSEAEK